MIQKVIKNRINTVMDTYLSSRKYDLRPIDCEHPLWQNISKTIKINTNDENEKIVDTYLEYAGVVFDPNSYNFHIFPEDKNIYRELSEELLALQKELCQYIKSEEEKLEFPLDADLKKSGGDYPFVRFENIEELQKVSNNRRLCVELIDGKIKHYNMYHYVTIFHKDVFYTINFMRYICDEKGRVGCTMRAIQFHKKRVKDINKKINIDTKVIFDICYPSDDKDGAIGLQSLQNQEGKYTGNICYNPPVEYPFMDLNQTEREKRIENIINQFILFVKSEEKIC